MKARPRIPQMGQILKKRLDKPLVAFYFTGTGYFGFTYVTLGRSKKIRSYVYLFINKCGIY